MNNTSPDSNHPNPNITSTLQHQFDSYLHCLVFVCTGNKCHGISLGTWTILQNLDNLVNGLLSTIGKTIPEKVAGNIDTLSAQKRLLQFLQCRRRSRGRTSKDGIDLGIGVGQKGLWILAVALQRNAVLTIQKFNSNLLKGDVGWRMGWCWSE